MKRSWIGTSWGALALTLACGPATNSVGSGGSDDSGSGTEDATSSMNPTTTTTTTTNGSAEGTSTTTTTGPLDTGSGSAEVTTDPGTTTGETSGSTDGGSSSGGPPPVSYPGCTEDADCSDPYTVCWPPPEFGTPNFCTLECVDAGECPEGDSGTAVPVCEGPPGTNICVLDCSMGDCPDGMSCIDIFGNGQFLRCTRN